MSPDLVARGKVTSRAPFVAGVASLGIACAHLQGDAPSCLDEWQLAVVRTLPTGATWDQYHRESNHLVIEVTEGRVREALAQAPPGTAAELIMTITHEGTQLKCRYTYEQDPGHDSDAAVSNFPPSPAGSWFLVPINCVERDKLRLRPGVTWVDFAIRFSTPDVEARFGDSQLPRIIVQIAPGEVRVNAAGDDDIAGASCDNLLAYSRGRLTSLLGLSLVFLSFVIYT